MSPLIVAFIIFVAWPGLWWFIGRQQGRGRLVVRSPIKINRRLPEPDDPVEVEHTEHRQSALARLRSQRDVGFGK